MLRIYTTMITDDQRADYTKSALRNILRTKGFSCHPFESFRCCVLCNISQDCNLLQKLPATQFISKRYALALSVSKDVFSTEELFFTIK